MLEHLNGASRIHYIVGDPIAQVKSPAGVTQALASRGLNAVVVPAHVAPVHLSAWLAGVSLAQNVDGIIVTVPHKFACFDLCATTSERAAFLRTVNTLRRNPDGSWHGDMFDGLGFVTALHSAGGALSGQAVLIAGAGGAGSAIAHAVVMAGARRLAIHDPDQDRRLALVARLSRLNRCDISQGSADPTGFDVVLNATPAGMQAHDPVPLDITRLQPAMFVGCVITQPAVTPLIAAARGAGCRTVTGADMFVQVRDRMVDFLMGA
jgi:shikimate dehydrogenase